jgi:xanthosine utilization system XapX-like protein
MMNAKRSFLAGICLAFVCSQIIAQSPPPPPMGILGITDRAARLSDSLPHTHSYT